MNFDEVLGAGHRIVGRRHGSWLRLVFLHAWFIALRTWLAVVRVHLAVSQVASPLVALSLCRLAWHGS